MIIPSTREVVMAEFNEIRRSHMIRQMALGFALMLGAANVLLTIETLARL